MAIKDAAAVYVGRFNPFHLGHAYVLEQALKTHKLVIVLVGSAHQARTPKNPFTFAERKDMIESWQRSAGIGFEFSRVNGMTGEGRNNLVILPLRDMASNNMWIKSVQNTVKSAMTQFCSERETILTDVYVTGSDRDDSTWYLNAFPQWKKDFKPAMGAARPGETDDLSATSVRKVLYTSQLNDIDIESLDKKLPLTTRQFIRRFMDNNLPELSRLRAEYDFILRGKAAWSVAPYPVTFNTADAVIIQSGHVLVVRRGNQPGLGLLALPGGYVNQHERIRDAAVREAIEETGIRLTTGKNAEEITMRMLKGSIRAQEVFDDPKRSERGRIITVAYLMRLDDERPLPAVKGQNVPFYEADGKDTVETLEAFWMPLDRALENPAQWFEDHIQILEWAVAQLDD
jgi:bifunctional NMN adenylyltransferase/nudix hydrolase